MMRRPLPVVVVDQGSTATKASVVGDDGVTIDAAAVRVARHESGAHIEHDANELAASVTSLLDRLLAANRAGALGLACQRSTCLLWERASGEPLTAAISWRDTRQAERVQALAEHAGSVARRTGLRLSPYYAAPKLAALLDALPDGRRRAERGEIVAGTLDAFLIHRLTGTPTTEPGQAGRTLLYNLDDNAWDPALGEIFGIPAAALPILQPSAGSRGEYRGIPLTAVAGDQQAALLGHGGWQRGVTAIHFGTGAFVLASTGDAPVRHPGLLTAALASLPTGSRYQIEGSVNSAGSAADWATRLTGERLTEWADRELVPEELPLVLPTLTGVAAPWWRPRARGLIANLTPEVGPAAILGGVLAGVAMRVLDCVEALTEAGVEPTVLRLSGKLTRLSGLVDLLADVGQVSVEVAENEESGLAGLARLTAAGISGDASVLAYTPAARRRREPLWDARRARQIRSRWHAFLEKALDLQPT